MGIEIPEEFGGPGMTFTDAIIVVEELAKVDPAVSVVCDVQNTLVNTVLMKYGTAEQQKRHLPALVVESIGSFCLSESTSGSDAFALRTTATRKGSDYVLNGSKMWITNSQEAALFLVFANVDPQKLGYRGITCFLVERTDPGLTVHPKERKLGIRASSTCTVSFDNVLLPRERLIGTEGQGYKIAIESLNEGRVGIAAQMLGLAKQALYTHALPYVQQRVQFGQPVSNFQVSHLSIIHRSCMHL
jgi:short/branched chain acyl-CoA dehydrogenase